MRITLLTSLALLLLAGCGGGSQPTPASNNTPGATPTGAPPPTAGTAATAPAAPSPSPARAAPPAGLDGRTAELVNPDNSAMVFLYHDLAGIAPPIDRWVEDDNRVKFAAAVDKPAQRATVRAELEAGAAAVRDTGVIRLSLNSANLSDYDPTYGEFTVRALAPSSVVSFDALGEKVGLRFANGKYAQIWHVPTAEAQGVRDRIAMAGNVELEVLLAIRSVLPGPAGGTITADVLEYEMRETRSGTTLARVQVPGP